MNHCHKRNLLRAHTLSLLLFPVALLLSGCQGNSGSTSSTTSSGSNSSATVIPTTPLAPIGDATFDGAAYNIFPYSMSVVQLQRGGPQAPLGTVNDGSGNLTLMPNPATIGLSAMFNPNRQQRDFRVADFNGDGVPDMVSNVYNDNPNTCASLDATSQLYFQNPGASGNGDGTFVEQASFRNFAIRGRGETIVVADFFNTGANDIFIPQYTFAFSPGCPDQPHSFLLKNDGSGKFTDVSTTSAVSLPAGSWTGGVCPVSGFDNDNCFRPEGAQAVDLDGDGNIDLYVASHLFMNNGDGTFTDKRIAYGLPIVRDEGAKFIDWNNDGNLDLIVNDARYGPTLFEFNGKTFVQRPRILPDGTPFFSDGGKPVDFGPNDAAYGMNAYDIDNDGREDVLITGGNACNNMVFHNNGKNFERAILPTSSSSSIPFSGLGNGGSAMAFGDISGNGRPDIAYSIGGSTICTNLVVTLFYFANTTATVNPSIIVEVLGPNGEHNQYGRVVRVNPQSSPSTIFTRVVDSGSGFLTQNQYPLIFGTTYSGSHTVSVRFAGGSLSVSALPGQTVSAYAPSATAPAHAVVATRAAAAAVQARNGMAIRMTASTGS
jgi:hypothetical protein